MTETRTCQNCSQGFSIEDEDFNFYKKIEVPPPTLCPDCRQQRRMAHRDKNYFLRNCDKCGKSSISIWHPDIKGYLFYCNDCWWKDDWDAFEYGRDFDFSRPFFEQFNELYKAVPKHISNAMLNMKNSDYCINASRSKDCYMADEIDESERCAYGYCVQNCKDCTDCLYVNECEIGYELVKCDNNYKVFYAYDSHACNNSAFLAHCRGVSNSLFCTNKYNVTNYLFNEPSTAEEVKKAWDEIFCGKNGKLQEALAKYQEILKSSISRPLIGTNVKNSSGNFLVNVQNCKDCYSIDNSINCKYCTDIHHSKDSMDVHIYISELSYESLHAWGYKQLFSHLLWNCSDATYADECHNSQDLFACCGLKKKQFCILNKPYSKEEYLELKEKIIAHMKQTGEYGEYFPVSMSPHGYNHTFAQEFYPMTEGEVKQRGWQWLPEINIRDKYKDKVITQLPDDIAETTPAICNEIFECEASGRFYRIIPDEYQFYKKHGLPLPRLSSQERDHLRWEKTKPRHLWDRECACAKQSHFHGASSCSNAFRTTHAPESPEIVYCEQCYQAEVV